MAPTNKIRARLAAGNGGLLDPQLVANRIFRQNMTTEDAPLPRHIVTLEDVTHGLGLDSADEQVVQRLIVDTNAHFDQTQQTQRIALARERFVTTLRAMPYISSDIRMELTKRVIAYWRRNVQTDYGKVPTIRSMAVKSEPTLVISKAAVYIGPRGGKWADAKHTIPSENKRAKPKTKRRLHAEEIAQSVLDIAARSKSHADFMNTVGAIARHESKAKARDWRAVQNAIEAKPDLIKDGLGALADVLTPPKKPRSQSAKPKKQDAISAAIKQMELEEQHAASPEAKVAATKQLKALWREFARTGAGYKAGKGNVRKADKIPGGLADKKKPSDFDKAKLAAGIKVEMEHTSDRGIATEIAMDHLTEDADYYEKLATIEKSEPVLSVPLEKAGPPRGYSAIPKGKRSGYRKRVGGKWQYWYPKPGKAAPKAAPKGDRLVAPNSYQGPIEPGHDLYQAEDAIRYDPFEHCAVFDADGAQLWRQTDGMTNSIQFTEAVINALKANGNAVFTHNHPKGTCLSADDIICAVHTNLAEIRAVGSTGRVYRIKRPAGGWIPQAFKEELAEPEMADHWFVQDFGRALRESTFTAQEASRRAMDQICESVDPTLPFGPGHPGYSEEKWNEINAEASKATYNQLFEKQGYGFQIEELAPGHREERAPTGRGVPAGRHSAGVPSKQGKAEQLGFDFDKSKFVVALSKGEQAARGGKYIKRVPYYVNGKRKFRYYYRESAAARDVTVGETVKLGDRVAEVLGIDKDGKITIRDGKRKRTVTADQWSKLMAKHYGDRYFEWAEKRASQTVNAVLRHVPREMLTDLKGTDAERMAQLEKRVPEVYAKLRASFQRSGVSPFEAKRVLGTVLERKGWEPEARAAVIGNVIEHRNMAYRQTIQGAENLAGGGKVKAGHVQAMADILDPPGGKTLKAEVDALAGKAETELATLSSALAKARDGNPKEALEAALNSPAMARLALVAQAMPGLRDKAIQPTRDAMAQVQAVVPRAQPTREGASAVVYVAGENGAPRALKARYKLVEASEAVASHDPNSFKQREGYPEGVQERAYHRDRAEQAKVMRNANKLNPAFLVNTNPDAVNGPPILDQNGVVLGGNSRTMSMQLAYEKHPDRAKELRAYMEAHAHETGFTPEDVKALKNPVLVRVVESTGPDDQKLLVRQMNESFTQGMDPRTMQVAMGRKLDDAAVKQLGDSMEADETLNAFLDSPRAEGFINALTRVGVIDQRNSNQYMVKGTKRLNEDGKQLVERVLVGRTVGDADLLSNTTAKIVGNIARSVPFMAQAKAHGATYDLGDDLKVALEQFNDLSFRARQGHRAALNADMSDKEFKGLFAQAEMFGERNPILDNPRAMTLLEVLIRKNGPQKMSAVFRDYAALAAQHPEDQDSMFGDKPSPEALLDRAMKGETKKSMEPTLIAKGGPYIGPKGGKWADPKHTIAWKEGGEKPSKQAKREAKSEKIATAEVTEGKTTFKTGEPVTFDYVRNTAAAPKARAGADDRYQQKIEPAGRYISHVDKANWGPEQPDQMRGSMTFNKPLVLHLNTGGPDASMYDENSWKARLQEAYGGKKGKALSRALAKEGFDGIVTVETTKRGSYTAEIVDLRFLHSGEVEKSMEPTLIVKARSILTPNIQVGEARGAPRFDTPPMPDYQGIYYPPEDEDAHKRERDQAMNRRKADAERARGKWGFHGKVLSAKPTIKWELDRTESEPAFKQPQDRETGKPLRVSPKLNARTREEKGKTTYASADTELEGEGKPKSKRKKKKKRVRLTARKR